MRVSNLENTFLALYSLLGELCSAFMINLNFHESIANSVSSKVLAGEAPFPVAVLAGKILGGHGPLV